MWKLTSFTSLQLPPNSVSAKKMLTDKLNFVNDEINSPNRRSANEQTSQNCRNLKFWIVKVADRANKQRKSWCCSRRNAEDRLHAKQKVIDAGNPLEEAAMEDNLDHVLRESDRILRYVRWRFHSEMDTRRRLAEERRDIIRQQNSRYEVTLAMGDERISELRKVFREQMKESATLTQWHNALEQEVFAANEKRLHTIYVYPSCFRKFENSVVICRMPLILLRCAQ